MRRLGQAPPAQCSSPCLPQCLLATGPESAGPVGEDRQRGLCGCWLGRGPWAQGPPCVVGGAHLPPVAPGHHMRTQLLPAWLPGSSPAAALHPGPALRPVHVGPQARLYMWAMSTERRPAAPLPRPAGPGQSPGAGLLSRKRGWVGWSYSSIRIVIPRPSILHPLGRPGLLAVCCWDP